MQNKKKFLHYIFWLVVIISVFGLFFSPLQPLIEQIKKTLPWAALGILLSEILLTTGFLLMLFVATPAFFRGFKRSIKTALYDILNVKNIVENFDWPHVAKKCNHSKTFWFGYWLSVVGAIGDGIIIILAIGRTLPIASWGLMILPFWDLGLTYFIRISIFRGIKKHT